MSPDVDEPKIIDSLRQIPRERWGGVLGFLDLLRDDDARILTAANLIQSDLVGMWADRTNLGENQEFARRLRHEAQTPRGAVDAPGH